MLFAAYTKETGVAVIVRHGDAAAMIDDVIGNEITPPADVLITPTVRGVYRAAEEGALRPIHSTVLEQRIAQALRDPDALWTALSVRAAGIAYGPGVADLTEPGAADALADPKFRGQLCLSSSAETTNRTVIAGLIERLGVREAELAVRGWLANLARPVFGTEDKLWIALENGDCGLGLVSNLGSAFLANSRLADVRVHELLPLHVDIEGVGIARHARNPEGTLALVEWLLSDDIQARHAGSMLAHPATHDYSGSKNVGVVAWHDEAAIKLAERAGYR
jgi:iron(III) transport system substrate-binding protein